MFNSILIAEFISQRIRLLAEHGIRIELSTDMNEFYEIGKKVKGAALSPLFDPAYFEVLPHNSFWIHGTDEDGETVHIQAAKLNDTGHSNLDVLLRQQLKLSFQSEVTETLSFSPAISKMKGRIAYHGDMWLSAKYRGKALGDTLGQLGVATIHNTFRPDFIYGFLEGELSTTGLLLRQGYWNFEQLNKEWVYAHPWLYQEDWVVYMSREDLDYMLMIDNEKKNTQRRPSVKFQN